MKINWKVRINNPKFWIGIVSTILLAANIKAETLTSWALVGQAFLSIVQNPYVLVLCIIAVWSVITDPTTPGISDSARALTYDKPGHISEEVNANGKEG